MKCLYVLTLCFILSGSNANLLDTLFAVTHKLVDYGSVAVQTALDKLTTDGVETLVTAGTNALASAIVGRRDVSQDHLKALNYLKQDAGKVESVLKSYSQQLQSIYDQIHSLEFLKGDIVEFMHKIDEVKQSHNAALDSITQQFVAKLSALKLNKRDLTGLLGQLQTTFTSTVQKFKDTFGGVTDKLNQQSGGLVANLVNGLTNLNGGLAQKLQTAKETAAQLLASGQETLAGLHETGKDLVHQTVNGLTGQAQQAVDTLLHPGN